MEIFKMIYSKGVCNLITILNFWNKFRTKVNVFIVTIHFSSPDFNLVPCIGLQSPHKAAGVVHLATLAVCLVNCLHQLVTIDEEVCPVLIPAVHPGLHAVGHLPCSRHRHSKDP